MRQLLYIACVSLLVACQSGQEFKQKVSKQKELTQNSEYDTEIRWTSYGIPHVKSDTWKGLGYGYAYAVAKDAVCVIAHEVMVVAGQRAKFQGPGEGRLESDIFHKKMLTQAVLDNFMAVQDVHSLEFITGYVQGFNRYLSDHTQSLPASCAGKPWVRAITEADVVRMNVGVGIRYGVGRFKRGLAEAKPPGSAQVFAPSDFSGFGGIGSNAIALGKSVTASGRGILFGNPHYAWVGPSRFHIIHTTIPGELDVMGVSLLSTPRVSIGFNKRYTVTASLFFSILSYI